MNFKKILAAFAASAVAASTMVFSASAIINIKAADVGTLDGGQLNFDLVEAGLNFEEARSAVITIEYGAEKEDTFGGSFFLNGAVCGWVQKSDNEFANDESRKINAVRAGEESTTYTMKLNIPEGTFGKADQAYTDGFYAQIFVQEWWGDPFYVKSIEVLGADGNPVSALPPRPADEEAADEAPADEAPAKEEAPAVEDEDEDEVPAATVDEDEDDDDADEAPVEAAPVEEAPVVVAAPAAGNVAAATDSSKGSPDTGIADVAAVAGIAIVAAGALLVSKKRK